MKNTINQSKSINKKPKTSLATIALASLLFINGCKTDNKIEPVIKPDPIDNSTIVIYNNELCDSQGKTVKKTDYDAGKYIGYSTIACDEAYDKISIGDNIEQKIPITIITSEATDINKFKGLISADEITQIAKQIVGEDKFEIVYDRDLIGKSTISKEEEENIRVGAKKSEVENKNYSQMGGLAAGGNGQPYTYIYKRIGTILSKIDKIRTNQKKTKTRLTLLLINGRNDGVYNGFAGVGGNNRVSVVGIPSDVGAVNEINTTIAHEGIHHIAQKEQYHDNVQNIFDKQGKNIYPIGGTGARGKNGNYQVGPFFVQNGANIKRLSKYDGNSYDIVLGSNIEASNPNTQSFAKRLQNFKQIVETPMTYDMDISSSGGRLASDQSTNILSEPCFDIDNHK